MVCRGRWRAGEFADAIAAVAHDPERDVNRYATSTPAGGPLLIEASQAPLAAGDTLAELQQRLTAAGFSGDAYETRLRAVALQRALRTMAAA